MMVFAGPIEDNLKDIGTPYNLPMDRILGNIQQPSNMCGYCHPYLDLQDTKNGANFAKMDGPCLFGGWSGELNHYKIILTMTFISLNINN